MVCVNWLILILMGAIAGGGIAVTVLSWLEGNRLAAVLIALSVLLALSIGPTLTIFKDQRPYFTEAC